MKKEISVYSKIIEMILLIVSAGIMALPVFFCLGMISDIIKFDFSEHYLRGMLVILIYILVIIGFFFLLIRAITIWVGSTSKIITIGLIMGLCLYLFFIIPVISDLRHAGLKLKIACPIPILAISLSLRNIYVQHKAKKR